MIVDLFAKFLVGIFTGVLGLIPSYSPNFSGLGGSLGNALAGANSFFPMVALGVCIVAVIGLRLFLFLVTLVTWVWDKVPFTFK